MKSSAQVVVIGGGVVGASKSFAQRPALDGVRQDDLGGLAAVLRG